MIFSRTRLAVAVMVGIALGVPACTGSDRGGEQSRPASSQESVSPGAAQSTPSAPAAPPAPTITGADLSGTVHAIGTVFKPCSAAMSTIGEPTSVFDPASGRMVNPPVPPPIPAGAELIGGGNPMYHCTLTGTPDALKIFYVWNFRTPSKGLEPARDHLMAGVAGIHDKTMTQVAELPAEFGGGPSGVIPTDGGPVLTYCCRNKGVVSAAIDPATLAVRWTSDDNVASHDRSTVAFYDVFESIVTIRDVATGSDTVVTGVSPTGPSPRTYAIDSGYVLDQTDGDNVGYYSVAAKQFFPNILVDDRVELEPQTNEGRLLLKGENTLKLVDTATGAVVFTLEPNEVEAVDSYRFANSGDYLYIANTSDSPVIDIRNRQQVSSGWRVRPQTILGKTWVLVDRRPNATDDCYEGTAGFGATADVEAITLERIENGVYGGPWY